MAIKYIIEGLDRLGKSTLVNGIQNKLGYFEVIHYSKPQVLNHYHSAIFDAHEAKRNALFAYQKDSFRTMFEILKSDAHIIMDRAHLGEAVYSPLYRGYSGDYVFELEHVYRADLLTDTRLILLTEDFEIAKHFVDDGESLGPIEKREEEQERFIAAFERSQFKDKRIVCVTDPSLGGFKPKERILQEVLHETF